MSEPRKKKRLLAPRTCIQPKTLADPTPSDRQTPEVYAAVKVGEEILRTIEDEVSDRVKEQNTGFFEGVEEKTKGITDTISRSNRVSDGQRKALDNMLDAVRKWTRERY